MESETADKILKQVFELFMNAIKVDYNYSIDFTFKKNVVALFSSQALFKKHGEFIKACIASQRSESEKAFYFIAKQAFKTQIGQYSRTDIKKWKRTTTIFKQTYFFIFKKSNVLPKRWA